MRDFFRTYWKAIVAIVVLAAIASMTMGQSAVPPDLPARLRNHVRAIAPAEHNTATPAALEQAARYIETTLAAEGYRVRRQPR
jgi:hypothetical protein